MGDVLCTTQPTQLTEEDMRLRGEVASLLKDTALNRPSSSSSASAKGSQVEEDGRSSSASSRRSEDARLMAMINQAGAPLRITHRILMAARQSPGRRKLFERAHEVYGSHVQRHLRRRINQVCFAVCLLAVGP